MSKPLQIDIVSDVMCPWCIIGYRQLAKALEDTGVEHAITWHPFELNPQMPQEGQNLREHLAQKYGTTPEQSVAARRRLTELGAELGFAFDYDDDMRMHNTFNAHQLLHWAGTQGRKSALKQALFAAHFTDQRNLSDVEVLADVAQEVGLDRKEALEVLDDQRYASTVREQERFWMEQGVSGVPSVVFDRQHLVTGALGVDTYTRVLQQLQEAAE